MWNECNCTVVWTFFGIAFLSNWNENWLFPVLWPLLNFPNLLAYWVLTSTASSFRIWNSSAGVPSPPLALFTVVLPKTHFSLVKPHLTLGCPQHHPSACPQSLHSLTPHTSHVLSSQYAPFSGASVNASYPNPTSQIRICTKCDPPLINA